MGQLLSDGKAKHLNALAFLELLQQDLPAVRQPHGIAIVIFHGANLRERNSLGCANLVFALQALRNVSQQQPGAGRDADRADNFRRSRRWWSALKTCFALRVKSGNIVTPNTTILTIITQVEPIYVTFSVPEARLADIRRYMAQGTLQVRARGQDGTDVEQGQLTFVDNNVDTTTGTIRLKGTFRNTDRKLWPGEYVNVTVRMSMQENALVLPNQAVQTGQDGTYVYVVKDDSTVEMRPVTTGLRVDQDMVIDKGVRGGETVVTEGQLRLAPGSRVQMSGANGPGGFRGGGGEGKGGDGKGSFQGKGKGRPQT